MNRSRFGVGAAIAALPLSAHADIGVPLIAAFLPPMWLSLLPIILLEAAVLARLLSSPFKQALAPAAIGNVATTFIGVPLTWLLLVQAEFACCGTAKGLETLGAKAYAVTIQAPWLIPYEEDLGWMIPIALFVVALPCLAASVAVEGLVNRRAWPSETQQVWKATWLANAASYAMLGLLMVPAWKVADYAQPFFNPVANWFVDTSFAIAKALHGTN